MGTVWSQVTYRSRRRLGNLLRELFELSVEHLPTFPLLLFELNLVLVSISVFPLPVTGLIELYIGGLAEELDVLR